jgi:hypothetical protein
MHQKHARKKSHHENSTRQIFKIQQRFLFRIKNPKMHVDDERITKRARKKAWALVAKLGGASVFAF